MTQTCETCGRSWGDRAMFCGACGALLNRPLPGRDGRTAAASPAWWRRPLVAGGVVVVALVGVVAAVPTLSIERQDPVDTSIDVPDSEDLQAAPADATVRPHVDPPEITCSEQDVEYDCIVWSRQVIQPPPPSNDSSPIWAFAADPGVVVGDEERVELIDPADGARVWSIDAPSDGFPRGVGDEFMAFSEFGATRVIDLEDGQARWTFDTRGSVDSDWLDGDVLYTAAGETGSSGVTARDLETGAALWTWATTWQDVHLRHLAPDRLLAMSWQTGHAAILDTRTGDEVARVDESFAMDWLLGVAEGIAVTVKVLDHGEPADGNPAGDGGAVLAGVDIETGTVQWEQEVRAAQSSFGVYEGLVLAPSARHLTALDASTGELVWEVPTANSETVVDHGGAWPWRPSSTEQDSSVEHVLTIDDSEGHLRARMPESGEVAWERPLAGLPWHATVIGDEVVVFGGEHLHVLTASTGRELLRLDARDQQFVQPDPLIVFDHRSGYLTRVDVPARAP